MLLKSDILKIVYLQQNSIEPLKFEIRREVEKQIKPDNFRLLILTGIKGCGKSTLINRLRKEHFPKALYLNFAHPRFYSFDGHDLYKLDEIIEESGHKTLFLDEVQKLTGWNSYIKQKLDEGFQCIVSSSDTSIFNSDADFGYPGLIRTVELFPFSYREYCVFHSFEKGTESLSSYMERGGFPLIQNSGSDEFLNQFLDDVLVRVIAAKYGVRDLKSFKRLAIHLLSNVANFVTGNKLRVHLGIKTTSTVMEYLSYLEAAYLIYYVPMYSYSIQKQMINPRKVYAADTGLVQANSVVFKDRTEQLLENLVFLHLRKQAAELYYFSETAHCDFVVMERNRVESVVQVCANLKQDNLEKELNGIFEAMDFFELKTGTLVTMDQNDRFEKDGKVVRVLPFYAYVS